MAKTKQKMDTISYNLFEDYAPSDGPNPIVAAASAALRSAASRQDDGSPQPEIDADSSLKQGKIEDFGEKIGGARKDVYQRYCASFLAAESLDASDAPLSKLWPIPNYDKLTESGVEAWKACAVHALRDALPKKPSKTSWRYGNTMRDWLRIYTELRIYATSVLNGELSSDDFHSLFSAPREGTSLGKNLRKNILLSTELYERLGHYADFDRCRISYYGGESWFRYNGEKYSDCYCVSVRTGDSDRFTQIIGAANTYQEGIDILADYYKENKEMQQKENKGSKGNGKFEILHWSQKRYFFIGRKYNGEWVEVVKPFQSPKDAREYLDSHPEEVASAFEKFKYVPFERNDDNEIRRVNGNPAIGEHVTPEQFSKEFGFRGVEFGNWVGNQKRQDDLDRAYYALKDLAHALNLPPRAISLGGTLGLAFGARGIGGKNSAVAHYEPSFEVINLTKKYGAGSLAHEWFHAVDHYFAFHQATKKGMYVTEMQGARSPDLGLREEMQRAFAMITSSFRSEAIQGTSVYQRSRKLDKYRSKPYWATNIEMAARCFEAYVKDRLASEGIRNDYLVNIRSAPEWEKEAEKNTERLDDTYPYPTKEELALVREAYDVFFRDVGTRTDEKGNTAMYSCSDYRMSRMENCNYVFDCELTDAQTALRDIARDAFGIDVEFFEGAKEFHGMLDPDSGKMLFNIASEEPLDSLFWHESFHGIAVSSPALYEEILAFSERTHPITQEQMNAFREKLHAPDLSDAACKEEILARAFADAKSREARLEEMQKDKPALLRRVASFLSDAAEKVKRIAGVSRQDGLLDASQMQDFMDGIQKLQARAIQDASIPETSRRVLLGDSAALSREIRLREAMDSPWLCEHSGKGMYWGAQKRQMHDKTFVRHLQKTGFRKKDIEAGMALAKGVSMKRDYENVQISLA